MKKHLGKSVVITGSARGLGRSMAEAFAEEGANVVVTDIMADSARETAKEIARMTGVETLAVGCNVTDRESVRTLMAETMNAFGKIDVLVNNAGVIRDASFMKMSEEYWDMVIDTDLKGVFICSQEAAKYMREARYGRIINISSMSGLM